MVGPVRPQFVLFGSSIVELSYSCEGWGATLANLYARKVLHISSSSSSSNIMVSYNVVSFFLLLVHDFDLHNLGLSDSRLLTHFFYCCE